MYLTTHHTHAQHLGICDHMNDKGHASVVVVRNVKYLCLCLPMASFSGSRILSLLSNILKMLSTRCKLNLRMVHAHVAW